MYSDRSEARLLELEYSVRGLAETLINWLRSYGYPIVIVEAYRSAARQRELYAQGRTTPGQVVTWTTTSRHQSGRAFDVAFVVAGELTWSPPTAWWRVVAFAGRYLGLKSGASYGDLGHLEGS